MFLMLMLRVHGVAKTNHACQFSCYFLRNSSDKIIVRAVKSILSLGKSVLFPPFPQHVQLAAQSRHA